MRLSELPERERSGILRVTKRLIRGLHRYFDPYPAFDQTRFPATALASAVENPGLPLNLLRDMAVVTVWIFTIDTVIDEKLLPEAELKARLSTYEDIVRGKRAEIHPDDPYGTVLRDWTKRIRSKPLFPFLQEVWEEAFCRMIRGMLLEAYDRPERITLEEYLEHGIYSIGAPLYIISGWILQSRETSLEHLNELVELLRLSGLCIRLANDLRTHEKERLENNTNAVFIREKEVGCRVPDGEKALALSLQYVKSLLQLYRDEFMAKSDHAYPFVEALRRLTCFSVDFYSDHDFHTITAAHIHTL